MTPRRPRTPVSANPIADLRRQFAEQGFQRIGGGQVVPGNRLRVLRDARENYPAWPAAIESARRTIHLEMYIVHDDVTGRRFRDALVARARGGRDGPGPLRLVRLAAAGRPRLLGAAACGGRRDPGGEPTELRQPAGLGQPRPSEAPHDRRRPRRSSPASALATRGRGIPRGGSRPGATPASSSPGRRWPTPRPPSPMPGHWPALRSRPPSCRAARLSRPRGPSRSG